MAKYNFHLESHWVATNVIIIHDIMSGSIAGKLAFYFEISHCFGEQNEIQTYSRFNANMRGSKLSAWKPNPKCLLDFHEWELRMIFPVGCVSVDLFRF